MKELLIELKILLFPRSEELILGSEEAAEFSDDSCCDYLLFEENTLCLLMREEEGEGVFVVVEGCPASTLPALMRLDVFC